MKTIPCVLSRQLPEMLAMGGIQQVIATWDFSTVSWDLNRGYSTGKRQRLMEQGKKTAGKTDRRVIKTRAAIKAALDKLVKEQGMDKLTVSALAREANIDRKTFYLHYDSIDDLIDSAASDMVEDIISTIDPGCLSANPGEQVRLTLAHVNEKICADVELYAYMANNLSMDFVLGHIERALKHYAKTAGVDRLPRELLADSDPDYYRPRFYLAGAVSVYSEWLCSDRTRPIEDVAEVVADALINARWSAVQGKAE